MHGVVDDAHVVPQKVQALAYGQDVPGVDARAPGGEDTCSTAVQRRLHRVLPVFVPEQYLGSEEEAMDPSQGGTLQLRGVHHFDLLPCECR
jgi:hypothetical protein